MGSVAAISWKTKIEYEKLTLKIIISFLWLGFGCASFSTVFMSVVWLMLLLLVGLDLLSDMVYDNGIWAGWRMMAFMVDDVKWWWRCFRYWYMNETLICWCFDSTEHTQNARLIPVFLFWLMIMNEMWSWNMVERRELKWSGKRIWFRSLR